MPEESLRLVTAAFCRGTRDHLGSSLQKPRAGPQSPRPTPSQPPPTPIRKGTGKDPSKQAPEGKSDISGGGGGGSVTLLSLLGAVCHLFQAVRGEPTDATFHLAFPEASFPDAKHWAGG